MVLRYDEFLNESKLNESGIPVYKGSVFTPISTIKRNRLLPEIQSLLDQVASGSIGEITILADIPSQGKNAPEYLKDIMKSVSMEPSGDEYDEETDTYMGNRDIHAEDGPNIFVDSEFIVSDVDMEKGVLIAEPFSLRGKGTMVEIAPNQVEEVFVK